MSRWLMLIGAIILAVGAVMHFAPGLFGWFGKLPGDISIRSENGRIFIPITSMIVVSIVLTVLLNLFKRW